MVGHLLSSFPPSTARRVLPAPRRGRGEKARWGPAAPCQSRCRARRAPRPHLWLVSGLRGLSLPLPAPSLFHVNNKYSHRRPRLVCAPRLPILRSRPFTRAARGAAAGIAPGIAIASRQPVTPGRGGGTPRGGSPWISVCPGAARARAGKGSLSRQIPSPRYIIQSSAMRGTEMSIVLIFKNHPIRPAPTKREGPKTRGGAGR